MSSSRASYAQRRYVRRIAISTAFYLMFLAAAVRFVGSGQVSGPLAYLLGALPGFAVMGIFWAFARLLIDEKDEFRRLLLVGQSLMATGFTLSVVTVWGFLQNFRLVPHIDAFYIALLWFIGLGIGSVYNRITLGVGDSETCR